MSISRSLAVKGEKNAFDKKLGGGVKWVKGVKRTNFQL